MRRDISSLFQAIGDADIPAGLEERVSMRVLSEVRREVWRTVFFARAGVFASAVFFVYSIVRYGGSIFASDFWSMARLLFSDASLVLSHGDDFAQSLFETFPVADAVFVLAPAFFLFVCLDRCVRTLPRRSCRYSV